MPSTIMSNAAAEPPTSESRYSAVDAETIQVLKGRVSDGSRENYESTNVKFLVWIYDNQEDHGGLLKSSLLREMETAHKTDGRAGLQPAIQASCVTRFVPSVGGG